MSGRPGIWSRATRQLGSTDRGRPEARSQAVSPKNIYLPRRHAIETRGLADYRALVAVRLTRPGDALTAFTESLSAARSAPKQRAVVMIQDLPSLGPFPTSGGLDLPTRGRRINRT